VKKSVIYASKKGNIIALVLLSLAFLLIVIGMATAYWGSFQNLPDGIIVNIGLFEASVTIAGITATTSVGALPCGSISPPSQSTLPPGYPTPPPSSGSYGFQSDSECSQLSASKAFSVFTILLTIPPFLLLGLALYNREKFQHLSKYSAYECFVAVVAGLITVAVFASMPSWTNGGIGFGYSIGLFLVGVIFDLIAGIVLLKVHEDPAFEQPRF